jgi:hypothetical protein
MVTDVCFVCRGSLENVFIVRLGWLPYRPFHNRF